MAVNYIIVGATIVAVGAGIYFLIKKAEESGSYVVDYKEVDIIKLASIGEWLKTLDVDMEDFGKSRRVYVIKNIVSSTSDIKLPDEIKAKLDNSTSKEVLAFVLSDMNNNTKNAIIVVGNAIEDKFKSMLHNEITEINLK